jgi:hypothetical protein
MPTYVTVPQAKALILEHIGGTKIFKSQDVNIEGTPAIRERPSASPGSFQSALSAAPEIKQLASSITANTNTAVATQAVVQNPVESFTTYITRTLPLEFRREAYGSQTPSSTAEREEAITTAVSVFSVLTQGVTGNTALIAHTDILVGRAAQSNTGPDALKTVFDVESEMDSIKKVVGDDGSAEQMSGSVLFLIDNKYTPRPAPGAAPLPLGRVGGTEFNNLRDLVEAAKAWCRISGNGSASQPNRMMARVWISQLATPIAELRKRTTQRNMIEDDTQAQQKVAAKMEVLGKLASITEAQSQTGSSSIFADSAVTSRLLTPAADKVAAAARSQFNAEQVARELESQAQASPQIDPPGAFPYVNGGPSPRWPDGTPVGPLPPLPDPE